MWSVVVRHYDAPFTLTTLLPQLRQVRIHKGQDVIFAVRAFLRRGHANPRLVSATADVLL